MSSGASAVGAALNEPVLSKAFTRFRLPWNWDGRPAVLQSRATDEAGNVQPTREALIADRGPPRSTPNVQAFPMEHFNAITSWGVNAMGEVSHVYA
jgi:sulfane dehydrogenase subunit SoxC